MSHTVNSEISMAFLIVKQAKVLYKLCESTKMLSPQRNAHSLYSKTMPLIKLSGHSPHSALPQHTTVTKTNLIHKDSGRCLFRRMRTDKSEQDVLFSSRALRDGHYVMAAVATPH